MGVADFFTTKLDEALGFRHVEAGPLVRSSYHAKRQVEAAGPSPATE